MKEEFKEIKYNNKITGYYISNFGRVYSTKSKKILKPSKMNKGTTYYEIQLMMNGKKKHYSIHRLVAEYFVKKENETYNIVNHIDGNIYNNKYNNLEWTTQQNNVVKGQMRTGRSFLGNANNCSLYKDGEKIGEFKSIRQAVKYAKNLGASPSSLQKYYKYKNFEIKKG